ncbi:alginate biosynthesis protein Alg44 [Azotobacter vinelandii CA]|uniref:Alginate biosynthesis protein Alg44 n=2 Tax=Azotobacter vinelandii TaxID=354 RepID=C1DP94_AZOVD|nr:alginate biosynthesis protein Alg44 [Azotobacter vinelandii]ACO77326.1 alginate biosynthesis protein Alg44 [Azotobacter vinelandii DJ]AGK13225.1 alginate biosynthesis protein Alg44 [Azotobacter vinelandii CA]AGK17512.1 alginate biosynthesis protein Alg44 [Azotobacter vinelandii CA6]WKN23001.1 alginate biosynthesis protein Alg44 [Azotobacter vinelandii]SFY01813.1 alginate biosynthesis protein Alg44 [Azotobacter vinelandii]
MNTATLNVNVVHESEAQRQHARVKLPGKIRFLGPNRETIEQRLIDISAGGFSFASGKPVTQQGAFHRGKLLFQLDSLGLAMDVEFQVRNLDPESGRTGCQFHGLGAREISTLRQMITSHLSGELVTVGDVICTLQRDNFTKARKGKGLAQQTMFERLRAVSFSLAIFIVGLGAFGLILKQLYDLYFVTHAESGMVSVPSMEVTMPREGTVQSLVGPDGLVANGAPIASFSASMLEMLKGHLSEEQLNPANVEKLFTRQMKGTLTSPCDCKVVAQRVADGQFASKGQVIFELLPRDAAATVEARFRYHDFAKVKPGTQVTFSVPGEDQPRRGRIVSTALQNEGLSSDIRVLIQPEQPLDSALAGQPVEVVIDHGPSYDWLIDKAVTAGL